jgi:hypothetical protein
MANNGGFVSKDMAFMATKRTLWPLECDLMQGLADRG